MVDHGVQQRNHSSNIQTTGQSSRLAASPQPTIDRSAAYPVSQVGVSMKEVYVDRRQTDAARMEQSR